MLLAEFGCIIVDNDDFKGRFLVNTGVLGITATGFAYNTHAGGGVGDEKWGRGAGVMVNLSMIGISVSINGMEDAAVNELGVDVIVEITDVFGVDVRPMFCCLCLPSKSKVFSLLRSFCFGCRAGKSYTKSSIAQKNLMDGEALLHGSTLSGESAG